MTLPTFIVLGAAKSGTTALYAYLSQHPEIYLSPHKEPGFFAFEGETLDFSGPGDATGINRITVTQIDMYARLFAAVRNQEAIGEASPVYLHVAKAADRISHHVPNAKLIAILRNPIDRAYSDFLYRRKNGNEPLADFLQALRAEEERMNRHWSPYFAYVDKGRYAKYLSRYYSLFPPERLRVVLYDDLLSDPTSLLREIFRYLEVDPSFTPDISLRYSASGVPKSEHAQRMLNLAKKSRMGRLMRRPIPAPHIHRWYSALQNSNLRPSPPMPADARDHLTTVYWDEIRELAELLQRDLTSWLPSNPTARRSHPPF